MKTFATFSWSLHLSLSYPPPLPAPAVKHDSPNFCHVAPLRSRLEDESFSLQAVLADSFLRAGPGSAALLLVAVFAASSDLFIHF